MNQMIILQLLVHAASLNSFLVFIHQDIFMKILNDLILGETNLMYIQVLF